MRRSFPASRSVTRSALVVIAGGAAALAVTGAATAAAAPGTTRVAVPNAQPKLGRAPSGRPAAGQTIQVRLYLAGRDSAARDAAVRAVSTPGSSQYGRYLSAAQYRARYAPSAASVTSVRSFLTANHLAVTSVPSNRLYVEASGTVAQVQKAFATTLANYSMDGTTVRAAATAPTVPASLGGTVTAVSGLASISSLMTPNHVSPQADAGAAPDRAAVKAAPAARSGTSAPPPDAFLNAPPCSAYYGEKVATTLPPAFGDKQPYAPCGYVPDQLQGLYGLSSVLAKGLNGRGVTVAITDAYAAPTILTDANTYATKHGQKAFAPGQFTQVVPKQPYRYGYDDPTGDQCGEQGWYGEETLDVEAVHATAPGAKITYVAARSCDNGDFADALNRIVDKHLADIVTNSWGGTDESNGSPQLDKVYQSIFSQAALEGIGMYFSSGDAGDGSDPTAVPPVAPVVQAPANSNLVTAVGGTSVAIGSRNQRLWETGWQTGTSTLTNGAWVPAPPGDYLYGGGGGTSRVFAQPFYQKGVVPPALSKRYSSSPGRVVPDVSAIGDPNTGMLVGQTQTFPDGTARYSEYRIGGTSLSSPAFAGIMAISDQIAGHPHGFANPALYRAAGSSAYYDARAVSPRAVVRVNYVNGVDSTGGLSTVLRSIDVTNGTILRTTAGYDDVTGLGTVNGPAFFAALR